MANTSSNLRKPVFAAKSWYRVLAVLAIGVAPNGSRCNPVFTNQDIKTIKDGLFGNGCHVPDGPEKHVFDAAHFPREEIFKEADAIVRGECQLGSDKTPFLARIEEEMKKTLLRILPPGCFRRSSREFPSNLKFSLHSAETGSDNSVWHRDDVLGYRQLGNEQVYMTVSFAEEEDSEASPCTRFLYGADAAMTINGALDESSKESCPKVDARRDSLLEMRTFIEGKWIRMVDSEGNISSVDTEDMFEDLCAEHIKCPKEGQVAFHFGNTVCNSRDRTDPEWDKICEEFSGALPKHFSIHRGPSPEESKHSRLFCRVDMLVSTTETRKIRARLADKGSQSCCFKFPWR